jgi:hypothetical protein
MAGSGNPAPAYLTVALNSVGWRVTPGSASILAGGLPSILSGSPANYGTSGLIVADIDAVAGLALTAALLHVAAWSWRARARLLAIGINVFGLVVFAIGVTGIIAPQQFSRISFDLAAVPLIEHIEWRIFTGCLLGIIAAFCVVTSEARLRYRSRTAAATPTTPTPVASPAAARNADPEPDVESLDDVEVLGEE